MRRLKSISITGLFGKLNHAITLNQERGITIIHGANGTGKTTVLKIVSQISRTIPSFLARLNFKQIKLGFQDSHALTIHKDGERHLHFELTQGKAKLGDFNTKRLASIRPEFIAYAVETGEESIRPLGSNRWLVANDQVVATEDLWEHIPFERLLRTGKQRRASLAELPSWLTDFWKDFDCTLIEEQRLLRVEEDRKRGRPLFKRVVEDYADKLRSQIKDVLGGYAEHSQQLDRTFPRRVVDALESPSPDFAELSQHLDKIEKRREELHRAGLIEKEPALVQIDPQKLKREEVAQILSVYTKDTQTKLEKFDDIYRRVTLFEELINSHFTRKFVKVSKDRGLHLVTDNNEHLDPASLSSGEQHILVLVYELIFGDIRQNHLVLIDEPELSLHPLWQLRFIDDLEKIRSINRMDFVLATHSPQIIGDKWPLTQELSVS
ncbi:AAA family ATPase [Hyalangium gracile]|uniref:AAA family ATPase n=1 Tax=Hyalangium gracile TaxID=394092 RepID=UPI001CC8EEA9|nr:AAA family ATPase [Hyalangium gracile]